MNILPIHHKLSTFIAILMGTSLAIFILIYAGYTTRWIISCSIALIILFIGMSLKNPKYFFLSLFFLSLPIESYNFIGQSSRIHYGGPGGFYHTFYDLPLLLLYLLWIPQILITKTAKVRFSKLDLCMFGLIGMSFFSMYNALDIKLCLYEIFRLIIMYLIFFYMANAVTEKRDLEFIIMALLIGLFSESLLGVYQFVQGKTFGMMLIGESEEMMTFMAPGAPISRVAGTLRHPNSFATYLVFFIPLAISLLFAPIKRRHKVLCGLVFLAAVSALILTLSRAGWVAFMISVFALFILVLKTRLVYLGRAVSLAVVGTILLIIIIFAFRGLIYTRLFSDDYGAARGRIPLMKVAMNIINTYPFLGIGINNYGEVMQTYDNTPEQISPIVHNSYLLIASEIGVIGLFFFLWFVVLLFKRGIRLMLTCNDRFIICITVGILAGISGFLAHLMAEPPFMVHHTFFIFWVISGLVMALKHMSQKRSNEYYQEAS